MEEIHRQLENLRQLNKQVSDILSTRVEEVLEDMSVTALCDLPEEDPLTIDEFLDMTVKTVNEAGESLAKCVLNFFFAFEIMILIQQKLLYARHMCS